jgi:hypothetical protein
MKGKKPMNCKHCQDALPNLLLDPTAAENAETRTHLDGCAKCARDLASVDATLALLDDWQAPGISPYFDQKLAVRLREAQTESAAGWFERMKMRLLFNTGHQFRTASVAGVVFALVIGGGGFGIATLQHTPPVRVSAAVNDLQMLDKNEQALQQMDQILQENTTDSDSDASLPHS